jgi:hypothetical protein
MQLMYCLIDVWNVIEHPRGDAASNAPSPNGSAWTSACWAGMPLSLVRATIAGASSAPATNAAVAGAWVAQR